MPNKPGEADSTAIHYAGTVSRVEYLEALRLHYRPTPLWTVLVGMLGVYLGGAFVLGALEGDYRLPNLISQLLGLLLGLVVYAVIFLCFSYRWWLPSISVLFYDRRQNICRGPVAGLIDDAHVILSGEDTETSYQWTTLKAYKTGNDIVLLYPASKRFLIFTRSLFSGPGDWEKFTSSLDGKGLKVRK